MIDVRRSIISWFSGPEEMTEALQVVFLSTADFKSFFQG
jgi:hypothetical protein